MKCLGRGRPSCFAYQGHAVTQGFGFFFFVLSFKVIQGGSKTLVAHGIHESFFTLFSFYTCESGQNILFFNVAFGSGSRLFIALTLQSTSIAQSGLQTHIFEHRFVLLFGIESQAFQFNSERFHGIAQLNKILHTTCDTTPKQSQVLTAFANHANVAVKILQRYTELEQLFCKLCGTTSCGCTRLCQLHVGVVLSIALFSSQFVYFAGCFDCSRRQLAQAHDQHFHNGAAWNHGCEHCGCC